MYEDRMRYESAQACYQRILDSFPDRSARTAVFQGRFGFG